MNADDLIRYAREARTPEELGGVFSVALENWHDAFWLLADVCRAVMEGRPRAFVREAVRSHGRSVQCVKRWSDWAALVPPPRPADKAPRTAAKEAGWRPPDKQARSQA